MAKGKPVGEIRRWRCVCAYDGTDYAGWQKQPTGDSIQDGIEKALEQIFGQPILTIGAGRTDAGVHAHGQVFHFDAPWPHETEAMLQAMRVRFPIGISPRSLKCVSSRFHSLISAKGKRYRYRVISGWAMPEVERFVHSLKGRFLETNPMREAASHFIGVHDFSSFSASRGKEEEFSKIRKVWKVDILERSGEIQFLVEGEGFLYKMVRSMVGALMDVGLGKLKPKEVREILESCKRTERIVSSPAKGLCLEKVFYRTPELGR